MNKLAISLLVSVFSFLCVGQEYNSDIVLMNEKNTINQFLNSSYSKMNVTTYRVVKGQNILEYESKYKRNRFNPSKINFNTNYTKEYILEDRKKSNGYYLINQQGQIKHYERTDINSKNVMVNTNYHDFIYKNNIILTEKIRFKTYQISGSVDIDSAVVLDSLCYKVDLKNDTLFQYKIDEPETYSYFCFNKNNLSKSLINVSGYTEEKSYSYNESNKLIFIVNILKSETGNEVKTVLKISYGKDGLIEKTEFYDKDNNLVELKVYSYN